MDRRGERARKREGKGNGDSQHLRQEGMARLLNDGRVHGGASAAAPRPYYSREERTGKQENQTEGHRAYSSRRGLTKLLQLRPAAVRDGPVIVAAVAADFPRSRHVRGGIERRTGAQPGGDMEDLRRRRGGHGSTRPTGGGASTGCPSHAPRRGQQPGKKGRSQAEGSRKTAGERGGCSVISNRWQSTQQGAAPSRGWHSAGGGTQQGAGIQQHEARGLEGEQEKLVTDESRQKRALDPMAVSLCSVHPSTTELLSITSLSCASTS